MKIAAPSRAIEPPKKSIFGALNALLKRPVGPSPEPGRAVDPAAPTPVSEQDIIEGLNACVAQRRQLELELEALAKHHDQLVEDGDDEAILEGERQNRLAMMRLDKVELLFGKLQAKLREAKRVTRAEHFAMRREALLVQAAKVYPFLKSAAEANAEWMGAVNAVLREFPDARDVLPGAPDIFPEDVRAFAADLEKFRRTVRVVTPTKLYSTAADAIKTALEAGEPPGWENPTPFGNDIAEAFKERRTIVATVPFYIDRKMVKPGEEVTLPAGEAGKLVAAGKAVWGATSRRAATGKREPA